MSFQRSIIEGNAWPALQFSANWSKCTSPPRCHHWWSSARLQWSFCRKCRGSPKRPTTACKQ